MAKKLKKEKCSVCNKLFIHLDRLFKDKKGGFICMDCKEEKND